MSSRYLVPGLCGGAVAALVRAIFGGWQDALVGVLVFAIVYGTILLAARAFSWQDAPVLYAAVAAVAVTAAFILTGGGQ